jgi:hypothetical protein
MITRLDQQLSTAATAIRAAMRDGLAARGRRE